MVRVKKAQHSSFSFNGEKMNVEIFVRNCEGYAGCGI